jgi:hypothetical protein
MTAQVGAMLGFSIIRQAGSTPGAPTENHDLAERLRRQRWVQDERARSHLRPQQRGVAAVVD